MNRQTDALQVIDKGLVQDSNNPILVNMRDELSKRTMAQQGATADPR